MEKRKGFCIAYIKKKLKDFRNHSNTKNDEDALFHAYWKVPLTFRERFLNDSRKKKTINVQTKEHFRNGNTYRHSLIIILWDVEAYLYIKPNSYLNIKYEGTLAVTLPIRGNALLGTTAFFISTFFFHEELCFIDVISG